jgi:hypothetical protein
MTITRTQILQHGARLTQRLEAAKAEETVQVPYADPPYVRSKEDLMRTHKDFLKAVSSMKCESADEMVVEAAARSKQAYETGSGLVTLAGSLIGGAALMFLPMVFFGGLDYQAGASFMSGADPFLALAVGAVGAGCVAAAFIGPQETKRNNFKLVPVHIQEWEQFIAK